ncbi:CPBP family glutamic-type intramembrane protease [Streptomyces decoyicus]|uniref:CPBP family glutamic-type intramembrane protease n=1 Tax=Streptomyces decoyicus TaxID=249567 RepID=UPI00339F9D2C
MTPNSPAPTDSPSTTSAGSAQGLREPRRAYRDMSVLLLLTCAPSLWVSLATFASTHFAAPPTWFGGTHPECLRLVSFAGTSAWLITLLVHRPLPGSGRRLAAALTLTATWITTTYGPGPLPDLAPLPMAAMAAWLCIELAREHGAPLAKPACGDGGLGASISVFSIVATGWLSGLVATRLHAVLPASTVMQGSQESSLGWTGGLLFPVANILFTSVMEEIVMVAAVCVLGRAAGTRTVTIYAVSISVRVLAHGYFGLAALALTLLGAASVWLYRRFGRPAHLAAAHAVVDLVPLVSLTLQS